MKVHPALMIVIAASASAQWLNYPTLARHAPLGYSVGPWDNDSFVVDRTGFSDRMWIDTNGHPHTDALHVIEKFHRADVGHAMPDTDLLEFICEERDMPHMVGKQ